jgi:KDO2-lipid IV(A) lauroyltransferase
MKKKSSKPKLLRYYIEYILVRFIFWVFNKSSIKTASNFCGFIGKYITKLICQINGRHKMAIKNLGLCFPEKTSTQKEQIMDKFYENVGRFFGEYVTQEQMNSSWIKENVEVIGEEIFEKYAKEGFFGITGHFSNWELIHKYLDSKGHKLNIIYKKQNNEFVEKAFIDKRPVNQIPKGSNAMRQLMGLIKEKKIIGILIDQRDNIAEKFPFFGRGARTGVAIQRLSLKYNYPMICTQVLRRRDDPNKFKIIFYPPLEIEETGNLDEDISRLTQATLDALESWIRKDPEQWFWIYDRWK